MNMIKKGQIKGVAKLDIRSQVEYARSNFWSCWITRADCESSFVLKKFLQYNPGMTPKQVRAS